MKRKTRPVRRRAPRVCPSANGWPSASGGAPEASGRRRGARLPARGPIFRPSGRYGNRRRRTSADGACSDVLSGREHDRRLLQGEGLGCREVARRAGGGGGGGPPNRRPGLGWGGRGFG